MAKKLNNRNAYDKAVLLQSKLLPYAAEVSLRTRGGSRRAGYLNKFARLQKKVRAQQRSESSGNTVRDWQRPY